MTADALRPGEVLRDEIGARPVLRREVLHDGMIFDLVREEVDFAPDVRFTREYLAHTGAVAVLGIDDQDRVLLIRQYRHPAGATLWEIPAGLLDVEGEDPARAAQRELREETEHAAEHLEPLVTVRPSAGSSNEVIRIYLATGLREEPVAGFERRDEESEIQVRRVPLAEVARAVLAGDVASGTLVAGVLALIARRAGV